MLSINRPTGTTLAASARDDRPDALQGRRVVAAEARLLADQPRELAQLAEQRVPLAVEGQGPPLGRVEGLRRRALVLREIPPPLLGDSVEPLAVRVRDCDAAEVFEELQ